MQIRDDQDTRMTYTGMIRFLQSEMEFSPSLVGLSNRRKKEVYKTTAREMMRLSEAFASAIRTVRPHHVRLSMHPSSSAAKLSIALTPTADGGYQKSPWHSCVAVGLDGKYRCVHSRGSEGYA
jgi:pyoverdine/dityrosine biosynthesis protein Dit1